LTDQLTLFLPDLLSNALFARLLCIVENIKLYRTIQILRNFPNDTILLCCACVDSNIVGCHTLQHILTLAYVNNLTLQLDAVDTWVFIFFRQPFPAKHGTDICNIVLIQILTPFQHAATYAA